MTGADAGNGGSGGLPVFGGSAEWLRGAGGSGDVVMSSRVRLARNIAGFPFQSRASEADRAQVLSLCRGAIAGAPALADRVTWVDARELTALERSVLVERQLISNQFAKGKIGGQAAQANAARGVAIDAAGERVSVMVNEEDHLRIQVFRAGLDLTGALAEADETDDALEGTLGYAFSPRFGYLTCCPTNVGTGARLSVMLHVPGLRLTGEIEKVKRAADDMGLAVRGFHGEGSETAGDFYQLSNQTTLGKSERVLLSEMEREIVPRVADYERHARRQLIEHRRPMLEDQVHRALGTALHARLLSTGEAMHVLSCLRLGLVMGVIEKPGERVVHDLMLAVQPAHLRVAHGRELSQHERKIERATAVRTRIGAAV